MTRTNAIIVAIITVISAMGIVTTKAGINAINSYNKEVYKKIHILE